MVAAILSSILFLISKEKPFDAKSEFSTIQFINLLRNKLLICLCLIGIFIQFITFSINFSYFPIYLNELSFSDSIVGNLVAFYTLASFIGTISSPRLIKRFGLWKIFIYSAILIGLTTLITPLFENLFLLIFLRLIGGIGGGIIFSSCMSSIVRGFQENYQASAMGIFQAVCYRNVFRTYIIGSYRFNINLESVFIFSSSVTLPIILISFLLKKEELAK